MAFLAPAKRGRGGARSATERGSFRSAPSSPLSVSPFDKTKLFPTEIDGEPLATYISWIAITYAITLTGHPVLVIPCGLDPDGLPFGLQLVGKRWGEAELLSAGLALEAALAEDAECRRPMPDLARLARH